MTRLNVLVGDVVVEIGDDELSGATADATRGAAAAATGSLEQVVLPGVRVHGGNDASTSGRAALRLGDYFGANTTSTSATLGLGDVLVAAGAALGTSLLGTAASPLLAGRGLDHIVQARVEVHARHLSCTALL